MAEELARVRDARIRGEPGIEPRHPVERVECLVVAAELEQRVPDDAVRAGLNCVRHARGRAVRDSTPSPRQRLRGRGGARVRAIRGRSRRGGSPARARALVQDAVGLGVIGRVAGLTGALLVLEAEEGERARRRRAARGARPEACGRGRRVTGGWERGDDSREWRRGRSRGLRRRGGRLGEDPAEQSRDGRGDTDRRRSARRSLRGRRLLPIVLVLRFIPRSVEMDPVPPVRRRSRGTGTRRGAACR